MAEEIKPVVDAAKPVIDTKTADKPVVDTAKAVDTAKPAVEDQTKPAINVKPETKAEVKPAEELKTLLDEAGAEEVKLDKDGKPIEEKKVVVPDTYEFKLPKGVTLDDASMALVTPMFKELGLDNDQAQKLVDLQLTLTKANEDAHVQAWETYLEGQKKEAKEYFGVKLPEVMRNVARARDTFMPKDANGKSALQDKLNTAGFSNDKDFLEMLDKVGRVIGEGKFVDGKRSAPVMGKAGQSQEQVTEGISLRKVYDKSYPQ
jgi:hypothetical protein